MKKNVKGILISLIVVIALAFTSMSVVFAAGSVTITKQPVSVTVEKDSTATVSVQAEGEGLTYKWYYKNAGSTKYSLTTTFKSNTYSVKMNKDRAGRQVYCVVKDKHGNTAKSDVAKLSMGTTLKITKQPASVKVANGKTAKATFNVQGDGLTYTWYYKDKGAKSYTKTTSYTSNSYSVKMNDARDGRLVLCIVTDKYGSKVQTKTVKLSMIRTAKITKQPVSVGANYGQKATVSFTAEGDGLTYTWYYKNKGKTSFSKTDSFKSNSYSVVMDDSRNGRQVYCVIKDKYGNTAKTDTVTLKNTSVYYITVNDGVKSTYKVGVDKTGEYSLKNPTRSGYEFAGWKDSYGNYFASKGEISSNKKIEAVWRVVSTSTIKQLEEHINAGAGEIRITGNITIHKTLYVNDDIRIFSDGNYKLSRYSGFDGDMFVVGYDKNGNAATSLGKRAVLSIGGGNGTLTIDGSKSYTKVDVVGSAVTVVESGKVNLYDGTKISNHKKVGNERAYERSSFSNEWTLDRVGGAAIYIANGTVNMYGGSLENNEVQTVSKTTTDAEGNTVTNENSSFGGAVYNFGTFNMYGGKITGNKALRGGAIYNDETILLAAGNISNNTAATYGGAIATSTSATSQTYVGSENGSKPMEFTNNSSNSAGGAIYSNLASPIVVKGNTVFTNNHSGTIGGAIYTGGTLSISDATFNENTATQGGAVYHKYSDANGPRRDMKIDNSTFTGNKANWGGAISLGSASATEGPISAIDNCRFENNKAASADNTNGDGGAIYATNHAEVKLTNSAFVGNNAAGSAGAIHVHDDSKVNVSKTDFTGNTAQNGGALNVAKGTLTLSGGKISENNATYGGAIFANPTTLEVKDVTFEANKATTTGGAVILNGADLVVSGKTKFIDNEAVTRGGAIDVTNYGTTHGSLAVTGGTFEGNSAKTGGAICLRTGCTADLKGSVLTGNSSTEANTSNAKDIGGGAAYVHENAKLTLNNVALSKNTSANYGGAIHVFKGSVDISGQSSIKESSASTGAAVYTYLCNENSIVDTEISNNTARWNGAVYTNAGTLTVKNVIANNNKADKGAAFYLSAGTSNLTDVTATGNEANNSGAVYVGSGQTTITGSDISSNTSAKTGGAVGMSDGTVTINNTTMNGNTAGSTGGAVQVDKGKLTVTGSELNSNKASNGASGGAILAYPSTVTIKDTVFDGNSAGYGGAISSNGAALDISGATEFNNNYAGTRGGAIDLTKSGTTMGTLESNGTSFVGNVTGGNGGAVYMVEGSTATFTGGNMDSNQAGSSASGGAIFAYPATVTIKDTVFDENSAGYGGAISSNGAALDISGATEFNDNYAGTRGGAIDLTKSGTTMGTLESNGTSFVGNVTGGNGGAVYMVEGSTATFTGGNMDSNQAGSSASGGAIFAYPSTVTIKDTVFDENSAGYGGAISANGAVVTVSGTSEFKNNTAAVRGGAVDATVSGEKITTLTVTDGTFEDNSSLTGGAIYLRTNCKADLKGTTLTGNSSTDVNASNSKEAGGGAVYVHTGAALTLDNATLSGNTSANYGGAIHVFKGSVDISGQSSITGSSASTGAAVYTYLCNENSIVDTEISNNTARWNGAVYTNSGTLTAKNVTATGNKADKGAVFYLSAGTNNLSNVTATGNQATNAGAIYVGSGETTIEDSNISYNTATSTGGAVRLDSGKLTVKNTAMNGNSSANGGAIYVAAGTLDVIGGTMNENIAGAGASGGAIYAAPSTITIKDTVFDGNSAGYGGAISSNGAALDISGAAEFNNNYAGTRGGAIDLTKSGTTMGTLESNGTSFVGNVTGGNGGAVYMVEGSTATFTGGNMDSNQAGSSASGGAIFAWPATITVVDTTFDGNSAGYGGAISSNGATVDVSGDVEFTNNTAGTRGGAIDLTVSGSNYSTLTMVGGKFDGNAAGTGGAVYLRTNSQVSLEGTVVSNNVSNSANSAQSKEIGGGAFYVHQNAELNLNAVAMDGNESAVYGGAIHVNKGTVNMDNQCSITNSYAGTHGAAMYLYTANSNVKNAEISNNEATWRGTVYIGDTGTHNFENIVAEGNKANEGGVFCLCDQPTVTLKNVTANNNTAKTSGGVIYQYAWGGKLDVIDCEFDSNNAASKGGALWAGAKGLVTVNNGTFSNNTAANGGAVYLDTSLMGGNASPARVVVTGNSVFEDNQATTGEGGAIYVADTTSAGTGATSLTMTGATLSGNKALNKGGALATDATSPNLLIDCTNCVFDANQSGYNFTGTSYPGGGAVAIQNGNGYSNGDPDASKIVFTGCTFTDNLGAGTGGAVDIRSCSYVKFNGLTATGNQSVKKWNGAVIYVTSEGSRLYMMGDVVASNNVAGGKDTFAYVNNAKAWVYTTHSSDADWATKTYSLSAINFNQPTLP